MFRSLLTKERSFDWISPVALMLFAAGLLFSVFGLDGFLALHPGWAGPDLYASAVNIDKTGTFLARGMYDDGTPLSYNHHPMLGFYFFYVVSKLGVTLTDKLQVGYLAAASVSAIGWLAVYKVLTGFKIRKETAAAAVIFVASSSFFMLYRTLVNFDCFSILCSAALLFAFSRIERAEKRLEKRDMTLILGLFAFTLLISWYSVAIIGVYLAVALARFWRRKELRNQVFFIGVGTGGIILAIVLWIVGTNYMIAGSFDDLKDFISKDAPLTRPDGPRSKSVEELFRCLGSFFEEMRPPRIMLALATLALIAQSFWFTRSARRKQALKDFREEWAHAPVMAALVMCAGILGFIWASRYWSAIHPFAYLYFAAPFALFAALAFAFIFARQRGLLLLFVAALTLVSLRLDQQWRLTNVAETERTRALLSVVEHEFPSGYSFTVAPSCSYFSGGMLIFVAATPNTWRATPSAAPPDKQVNQDCIDPDKGILRLSVQDGKTAFTVRPGDPNYHKVNMP